MIRMKDVTLAFNGHVVLDKVNLSARFHGKIAILGRSGSGKTSILRLLLGLVRPDYGQILIDGQDITRLSESQMREARMNFSIVFQEGALFDSLSVYENVAFCLKEYSNLPETAIEERVRALLRRLDIEDALELMPEELSGGMQRRVAIARSLAECEPKMVLYDEPTTGLDPITADQTCRLIKELSAGEPPNRKGFIIVTHEVKDAVEVAERILFLKDGRLVFDGALDELRRARDPAIQRFVRGVLDQLEMQ